MIVKNEAKIICNTLDNILKYIPITYWVISDTGSTDDTIELIKNYFNNKNINGELVEHKWQDFGYNRTKALECAFNKTDYLFIFDADDKINGNLILPILDKDSYKLKFGNRFEYHRILLINNHIKWKFIGVLHEYIHCELQTTNEIINGNYYIESGRSGNRNQDSDKYKKDAIILENAFNNEKNIELANRYAFYCAQSWKDYNNIDNAILWYKKCLERDNWSQEKYYSCLCIGNLYKKKNDMIQAIKYWLNTINYDNERIEGIVEAMEYLRVEGLHLFVSSLYNKYKNYNRNPTNKLFINKTKYDLLIEYNMSISAYYCNEKDIGLKCCKKILMNYNNISLNIVNQTLSNIIFYNIIYNKKLCNIVDEIICLLSNNGYIIDESVLDFWVKIKII
jgi:tetratricopeptide (TPR) repeat protein